MKNQANRKIADDFLAAYSTHDFSEMAKLLHDDIEWCLPGKSQISGIAKGPEAVINRVKIIISHGIKTQINHILIGQNGIALSLHNTATSPDGRILDEQLATVLTIESDRIKRIDTYLSDVPMMELFF